SAAEEDQRALTNFCRERAPAVTDLPFDRIAQATQPTSAQRSALDELKVVSANAAESLKANCPIYAAVTPTGRIEAMEKRLEGTYGAGLAVQPALTKFYDGLSDEQKARFNSLRADAPPPGLLLCQAMSCFSIAATAAASCCSRKPSPLRTTCAPP